MELMTYISQIWERFQDGICITNSEGIVLQVNNKHAQISGMSREDMLGHSVHDFLHEGKVDIILNPEVFATGKKVTRVQKTADGRKIILEANPIFDEKGTTVLCVTFTRDITMLSAMRGQIAAQKELLDTFQNLNQQGGRIKIPKVVHSPAMQRLYGELSAIAQTDANVLILGETGVGKDVVARNIHELSLRNKQPFIKVDCGSIPENLIETELFGYVAGTFSGANKNGKIGLIEAAAGGTLFLDEIGELPMQMQTRLLRFLQDREIVRVGSTAPKPVDVRILSATNKNLEKSISGRQFRSDLYFRLKVAVINIPPLRERGMDIIPMAQIFLEYYGNKYHKRLILSAEAEKLLLHYKWPGNVRELENLIQGLVVTCKNKTVLASDLSFSGVVFKQPSKHKPDTSTLHLEGMTYKEIVHDMELQILSSLIKQYGSVGEVARRFKVDRSTLYRKARELEGHDIS